MQTVTVLTGFLLVAAAASSQTIRVAPAIEVARETEPRRFSEPHLAIHPTDPNRLMAAAFILPAAGTTEQQHAGERCATFTSRDGGATWTRHEFPYADCIDPQVALLPDGQAVFVANAEMPSLVPKTGTWLFAFHSGDSGLTWDPSPTLIGRPTHDHPAIAVDLNSAARKGWFYISSNYLSRDGSGKLVSQMSLVRSRNGGQSFDGPLIVHPNSLRTFSEMPVVLSDGTVIASFTDGVDARPFLARRRAWIVRSTDGGTSASHPMFVSDECGPPPNYQLSALAADHWSGPFRDRLYFPCRRADGGPIMVAASGDRGETWTRPAVAVGSSPDDKIARRVMTMAVNNQGVLGVLVVERKASGPTCLETDFFASLDGGASFGPPARVSSSMCGTSPADGIADRMTPTYGDYFGLVTAPDGTFRAMWPEMRDGHSILLMARVAVDGQVRAPASKPQ